jgi:hypothetical protein
MYKTSLLMAVLAAAIFTLMLPACNAVNRAPETPVSAIKTASLTTPVPTDAQPAAGKTLPAPTPFSFAWIGDTQQYTAKDNDVFSTMTQWINDSQKEYNTVFTIHTGDIVYNPYQAYQWDNGVRAFSLLPAGMRVLTVAGNHDFLEKDDPNTPYLDKRPDTDDSSAYALDKQGYVYYTTFTEGGVPFLVFSVSYGFEVGAVDWINRICARYPDHYAVLCLHTYVDEGGYSSVGKRIFMSVVKHSRNIRMVLCGHARGAVYWPEELDDDGDGKPDRTVHQMMMDTQDDDDKGTGFLRILRFHPENDTIEVVTYSPWFDRFGYNSIGGDQFAGTQILQDAGLSGFTTATAPLD